MKTVDNTSAIKWCISQHENTNHMYDKYLPYEFHLRMVAKVAKDFQHLMDPMAFAKNTFESRITEDFAFHYMASTLEIAAFGHDLIEDTRSTYNDVKKVTGELAADIIYALTNEKGKNRAERGNEKYYEGIRNQPGAVFLKLCDRIANVQYSKMSGSRMFEMYKKENPEFLKKMGFIEGVGHRLDPMVSYLVSLFEDVKINEGNFVQ